VDKGHWTACMKKAALEAGAAVMQVYDTVDVIVEHKADRSPLTQADKAAHDIIKKELDVTGIPILSEEGKAIPYDERKHWETFWLVDPLDGTKEFISRSKEFTVNIALIRNGKPVTGVVYAPALDVLYWNDLEGHAWKQKKGSPEERIQTQPSGNIQCIVASKLHLNEPTRAFLNKYPKAQIRNIGSSLKFMLVAEGSADCYPRLAPTMEWDTAAAQAIVEAAGGRVINHDSLVPLSYNKENLLNPWFVVYAGKS
jgi:3'(2'), 5'-bisphosphate nucleotidase